VGTAAIRPTTPRARRPERPIFTCACRNVVAATAAAARIDGPTTRGLRGGERRGTAQGRASQRAITREVIANRPSSFTVQNSMTSTTTELLPGTRRDPTRAEEHGAWRWTVSNVHRFAQAPSSGTLRLRREGNRTTLAPAKESEWRRPVYSSSASNRVWSVRAGGRGASKMCLTGDGCPRCSDGLCELSTGPAGAMGPAIVGVISTDILHFLARVLAIQAAR